MHQLDFEDQIIEVSDQAYRLLLEGVVGGIHEFAKTSCDSNVSGFPHWSALTQRALDQLQGLIPQISDEELRELLSSLDFQAQRMARLDSELDGVIAEFVGLPTPRTRQDRRKLEQRMRKHATAGPIWVTQPQYRQLVEQSRQTLAKVEEIEQRIYQRMSQLFGVYEGAFSQTGGEISPPGPSGESRGVRSEDRTTRGRAIDVVIGDQRASDLIDEAEDELDPGRAIKLLHRALRFGRIGVQASKAYLGLGMRYEDLGQKSRAIKYYTKSMEVFKPFEIALYWRGVLYYETEQWESARSDFEQALALGLGSPEREQAKSYLARLSESSS